ncbi:MAG: hypothetical protein ABW116_09380 [Candidatus Sedimenticola sp. 20ELBAFRAG]
MTRDVTLLWVDAGKVLAENPAAFVYCPVCGREYLHVKDTRSAENPSVIEREMICPSCGAHNYLRLVRPQEAGDSEGEAH